MNFPLIPLDEAIVFPAVTATLPSDVGDEDRVFLLPRRRGEFGRIGVVAEVVERAQLPNGMSVATVVSLHRGLAGAATPGAGDELLIDVQELHDGNPNDERSHELMREYRAVVEEILELRGADDRIAAFLRGIDEPGALADTAGYSPDLSAEQKLRLLETLDVTARLELAVEMQRERLAELQVRRKIRDDVDKVGADWRGDPSAALLEVLDPAQNHSFRDHYLDVELDLSEVVFLATANVAETIPGPLLDRMEVIGFDGYTTEEKLAIARGYLWPRQLERNGLRQEEVEVSDALLRTVITEYTREAGVRQLERELGKLLRRVATRVASGEAQATVVLDPAAVTDALGRQRFFQESVERTAIPGVATGLAVTGTGGDVLFIEATAMDGDKGLVLTGQLGDVMKESARIALSYVRSHADELGLDPEAFQREFHVHVPAGAIPKDGPSAGIAMTTAIASLLTSRPVKHTVGMTGELTLQGRVLPIGGLKQKVLAAHAAGLTEVFLPERNRGDLDDVPEEIREQMTFHPVMSIDEVLDGALEPAGQRADVAPVS